MEEHNSMTENKRETKLGVKTKLVITKTEDFFGPGLFHLLQFIDESKCWKLLNRAEEQMGFQFLNRYNGGPHGGTSILTEEGREFIKRYEEMLEEVKQISQNVFEKYFDSYQ